MRLVKGEILEGRKPKIDFRDNVRAEYFTSLDHAIYLQVVQIYDTLELLE